MKDGYVQGGDIDGGRGDGVILLLVGHLLMKDLR